MTKTCDLVVIGTGTAASVAAGAVPMRLGIPGEEHLVTSTGFLELESLPKRVALLGGGYIAAEFAHIAARAGAQVTVLEQMDRMLLPFDPDLVAWLMDRSRELGIDLRTGTRVEGVERHADRCTVRATADGREEVFTADLVVHAAGRVPDLEPLDLDAAGVKREQGRLALNEHLQSVSNPAVHAAGDAAAKGPPLTPVASHDLGVPSVAFTIPPIASVGLQEKAARDQGLEFRVHREKASGWYTARRVAEPTYGFKVLVEEGTDRILGAHLIGPHADEVINIFGLVIRNGLTAENLKTT